MSYGITETPLRRPGAPVLILLGIGLALLLARHWVHVAGFLPFVFLLACPLMHLFHGHGGHGEHDGPQHSTDAPRNAAR